MLVTSAVLSMWSRLSLLVSLLTVTACASPPAPPAAHAAPAPSLASSGFAPFTPALAGRVPLVDITSCPMREWSPGEVRRSIIISAENSRAVFAPVSDAVCRCTRPGDRLGVTLRIMPERGEVSMDAPDHPAVAACLTSLSPASFAAFTVGSDCVDCGPHPLDPSRPPVTPSATVVYPLLVDRTDEP